MKEISELLFPENTLYAEDHEWAKIEDGVATVGINDYGPGHRALRNAINDARVVASRLEDDFGFAVTLLIDGQATAEAIRGCLARWQAEVRWEDDVLVFFAGHGTSLRPEDGDPEGYLLPADAGHDSASWLPEAEIVERVRAMATGRIFLIFDACYAGTALRLSKARPPSGRDDQVLEILVAGTEDEPVLDAGAGDHSIFTRAVLDGLDGLADVGKRPDGVVTAGELTAYVRSEVPWRSRLRGSAAFGEQTPVGGALQGTRGGENFEFRPSRPRLPAALLRNVYSSQAEDRIAAAEQLKTHHGTETAALAAEELLHLVRNDRGQEGDPILAGDELLRVQRAALQALGELGHPAGLPLLIDLVSEAGREPRLREAAAPALGRLLKQSPGAEAQTRQAAIDALIAALRDPHAGVREAAKKGLSRVPAAGRRLQEELTRESAPREQITDALACIAIAQPDDARAWPALGKGASLRRRYHLLRRRLAGPLRELMLHAAVVGLAGMLGLGLAFVPVSLVAFQGVADLYVPAILAVCALPGFVAGVAYAALPPLSRAASRPKRSGGRVPTLVGLLLASLFFGPCLAVPNWFLNIGGDLLGSSLRAWVHFLLPGLIVGPLLGLALGALLHQPRGAAIQPEPKTEGTGRAQAPAMLAVGLVAGVAFALVRIPPALALGSIDLPGAEQVLWGLGGFLFGLLLAAAWSLPLSPAEGATPAIGQAWTFLAGGSGSGTGKGGR